MKIGILLPYKENFSPDYPGAVSLFVYETSKKSKYRKNITVFGNTKYKKKKFENNYNSIFLKEHILKVKPQTDLLESKNKFIKKETIPKRIRELVWTTHNSEVFSNKCYVSWCDNKINVFNFPINSFIK